MLLVFIKNLYWVIIFYVVINYYYYFVLINFLTLSLYQIKEIAMMIIV